jgi:hypothetical protein
MCSDLRRADASQLSGDELRKPNYCIGHDAECHERLVKGNELGNP